MSTFADWQPQYAAHHISTFPVAIIGDRKKPMVSGYLKLGDQVSQQLVMKFPDADALGFALGHRSRVTVLDVDSPDERVLADALGRHGETPVIVRSGGSGCFHAWYRHAGERRKVRPFAGLPIDVLGGGFVVAPPSRASQGSYEFISGGLDDLDSLPALAGLPSNIVVPASNLSAAPIKSDEGRRNDGLWRYCMHQARSCRSLDELLLRAKKRNEDIMPPLPDDEVHKIASSAWKYESEGRNFIGGGSSAILRYRLIDSLAASDPHAFALYAVLQRHHWDRDDFAIANSFAVTLGWHVDRLRTARNALLTSNVIRCIHEGGKGRNDPPLYAWT